jgi:hypothetical protein
MPSTAYESGNKSTLMETVTANFPNAHVTTVSRKYFNEEKGAFHSHFSTCGLCYRKDAVTLLHSVYKSPLSQLCIVSIRV